MIKGIFYSLMLCVSISTLNGMPFLHLMVQLPQVGVEQANAPVNYDNVANLIKQDKTHRYRVMDLSSGNPFINANAAKEFLSSQLPKAEGQVKEAEANLRTFKEKNNKLHVIDN